MWRTIIAARRCVTTDEPGATMRKHRRTTDTISNNLHDDNFNPEDALENLHAAISRIDTLVHVASDAADQMACPSSPTARRAFTRMQILIGKAAEEVSTALVDGDKAMTSLVDYQKLHRAGGV